MAVQNVSFQLGIAVGRGSGRTLRLQKLGVRVMKQRLADFLEKAFQLLRLLFGGRADFFEKGCQANGFRLVAVYPSHDGCGRQTDPRVAQLPLAAAKILHRFSCPGAALQHESPLAVRKRQRFFLDQLFVDQGFHDLPENPSAYLGVFGTAQGGLPILHRESGIKRFAHNVLHGFTPSW
ncbi:hypothetical protein EDM54_22350 [Brevibacillus borstelensis]|nr:hypothetical protein EDM54_22350 [Brevibacillus borstelensis]